MVDVDIVRDHVRIECGDLLRVAKVRSVPESVVYLLLRRGEVVYVGRSEAVYWRLGHHSRDKDFDAWAYIDLPYEEAKRVEQFLIDALSPEYNERGDIAGRERARRRREKKKREKARREEAVDWSDDPELRRLQEQHMKLPRW